MKRVLRVALLLLVAAALVPADSQKKTESFWARLLRISGVSASPASLRGEDRVAPGDVWWIVVAQKSAPQRLTSGGGFYSPVFDSQDRNILALRSGDLYRIPMTGEPPMKVHALASATKLVGLSRDDPDQLLVLGHDAEPFVAMVSVKTGTIGRIPYDPRASEDKIMLAHLAGWERVYGDTRLYVENNEVEGPGGASLQFSDIYLKHSDDPPINLTHGNNVSSSQPSLSTDGRKVVFIRSEQ